MANYLYNGINLPALPETTSPYKVIVQSNSSGDYFFMGDDEKFTAGADGDTERLFPSVAYALENGEWVESVGRTNCKAIWSNHDILNSDGTLYLAASEPVPIVPTPPSAQTAFCIGKAFGRMIRNAMKPVEIPQTAAYCLYNGVKLPNIDTVWTDKVGYPWAGTALIGGNRGLFISTAPFSVNTSNSTFVASADCSYNQYILSDEAWVYDSTQTVKSGTVLAPFSIVELGWCNGGDVVDENGTVYLAASDPVPVYE